MNFLKIPKLVSLNILFFSLFICTVELILGDWRKNFFENNEYLQIPGLERNKIFKYDVKKLYSSQKPVNVLYKRDAHGYRSRDLISNKQIVLTIGGSTTNQRYVSEGETFQDILDLKFKNYDFVNGGIDGQSSYGHLLSILNWHSKFLDKDDVSIVIFYVGINDRRLVNQKFSDSDFAQSKRRYIKNLFKDNSFFVSKFLELRNRIEFFLYSKTEINDLLSSYTPREKDFKIIGEKIIFNENINKKVYLNYKEIFSNLITQTRNNFPKSKIFIIQQQVPGCNFVSKEIVYDRYPDLGEENKAYNNYCAPLLKVFKLQEKILSEFKIKKNVELIPMYLQNIIKDDGVYDYTHTNKKGSRSIANYIESIIIKNEN